MGDENDDYWNESDTKAFSFDEGEFSSKSTLFDGGRHGARGSSSDTSIITDIMFDGVLLPHKRLTDRPLGSLVSPFSLNCIMDEQAVKPKGPQSVDEELKILKRQVAQHWIPADVERTIKLILTGQPYSLHLYRSLELKTRLLDEAIKSGDGSAILAVVLYLCKTIKKSLLNQLLQSRPVAAAHYVQYLSTRLLIHDVIDLLEMLGMHQEAAMKQFQFSAHSAQNAERKLQKMKQCYSNHFSGSDAKDKQFVLNYITYLEWIRAATPLVSNLACGSVLASLGHVCRTHWTESKGSLTSPLTLHANMSISERQFQWVVLCTRASLHAWEDIESLFITKGWLGGRKLKSAITMDKLVVELHNHEAPQSVLAQYLVLVDNLEKRLEISRKLSCHKVAIDSYVTMKDRQGLVEYKATLNVQSEDYIYAENALRTAVKWKN